MNVLLLQELNEWSSCMTLYMYPCWLSSHSTGTYPVCYASSRVWQWQWGWCYWYSLCQSRWSGLLFQDNFTPPVTYQSFVQFFTTTLNFRLTRKWSYCCRRLYFVKECVNSYVTPSILHYMALIVTPVNSCICIYICAKCFNYYTVVWSDVL